jgi:predicted amidohydrolase
MPQLRIALAQVDPTVGDFPGNAALVRGQTRRAVDAGAQLVAFPEMMLTGYPVEDLVFRDSFAAASKKALRRLAGDLATDGLGDVAGGSPPRTSSTTCPTTASSTRTGTSSPATRCGSCGSAGSTSR